MNPIASRELPLDRQSVVLEGPERIHVSPKCDIKNKEYVMHSLYSDVTTAYNLFLRGERVSNDGCCLGWRPSTTEPYRWMRYSEARKLAQYFGSALLAKGFPPSSESKIGIYSQNCPEWKLADIGCMMFSMVSVPLYTTLGPEGRLHIINLVKMKLIVVDTVEKVNDLLEQRRHMPTLKCIVVLETPLHDDLRLGAQEAGVELLSFDALMELGERTPREPVPPKPEDVAVIRFTSGTTGTPKGAITTHANIVSAVAGCYALAQHSYAIQPGCIGMSYLPLAHVYEHIIQMVLLVHGGAIGFFSGSLDRLFLDMQELKPNFFPCVPRLANKLYDMIIGRMNSSSYLWRKTFMSAFSEKKKDREQGTLHKDDWADQHVFKKEKDELGGRVEMVSTGGAPISQEVKLLMEIVYGCPILEGYGQTETTGVTSLTLAVDQVSGHVGAPCPCTMIKLVDVEEMGYLASQDKGEVCVKGPNVFSGYYENPEKTAEALDEDGWLHTGDIGEWLPNGALRLIDRKKHIYKLSQGEYIAPEKIENILMRSSLVSQAFVYGDSLKSYNVAIFVPDEIELKKFATDNKLGGGLVELCTNERVRLAIRQDVDRLSKTARLSGVEKIGKFSLHPEPFTIENGLLTPTMKNKRTAIKDRFQAEIDSMYGGQTESGLVAKHKL